MQGTTAPPFRSDQAHTTSLLIYRQNQKLLGDAGHLRSYCTPNYKRILLGQGLPLGTAATGQVIHVLRDHPGPWHPGPHPLDARSTPSRDHHRCGQTLPSVPGGWRGGMDSTLVKNHWFREKKGDSRERNGSSLGAGEKSSGISAIRKSAFCSFAHEKADEYVSLQPGVDIFQEGNLKILHQDSFNLSTQWQTIVTPGKC